MKQHSEKTLLQGTGIVGILTALSRVLGFARDLAFALIFGAGSSADAFFVAFRVPNLLRSFVAEGALTSAFVPVFSDALEDGEEVAKRTLREAFGFILTITALLTIIGYLFAGDVVALLAPGFDPQKAALCADLLKIMLPFIVMLSMVAMINGALNTVHIFGAAPLAQIVMNGTLIIGVLSSFLVSGENKIYLISSWVLVGGILQVIAQLPSMRRAGFGITPSFSFLTPAIKQIAFLMVPAICAAAVYQLSIILNTILASLLVDGSVSWLYYADRVAQLPIGIFTIALSSVLLPLLSRSVSRADETTYSKTTVDGLRYVSFVLIPIATFFFIVSEDIIRFLYERGQFGPLSTLMVASVLRGYTLGLWAISCQSVLSRAFIARKDPLTPAIISMVALVGGLHVSLLTMGDITQNLTNDPSIFVKALTWYQHTLRQWLPSTPLGPTGLALGSSSMSLFSCLLFILLFKNRQKSVDLTPFVRSTLRALFASAGMALLLGTAALPLLLSCLLGPATYLIFSLILRSEEALSIFSLIKRYK